MSEEPQFFCFESVGDEFTVLSSEESFDGAKKSCEELGATPARVSSAEELDFVLSTGNELNETGSIGWVGVELKEGLDDPTLPENFEFSDKFANISFFNSTGKFPWNENQPDGEGNCVSFTFGNGTDDGWFSADCNSTAKPVCRRSCSEEANEDDTFKTVIIIVAGVAAFGIIASLAYRFREERTSEKLQNKLTTMNEEDERALQEEEDNFFRRFYNWTSGRSLRKNYYRPDN